MSRGKAAKVGWWWVGSRPFWLLIGLVLLIVPALVYASVYMSVEEFWLLLVAASVVLGVCLILVWGVGKTVPMTRKGKAFWIGFLAPVVLLWVWTFISAASVFTSDPGRWRGWMWQGRMWTPAAIVAGGLVGLVAYLCTSGAPMSRRWKAALIGFFVPVVLASGGIFGAQLLCEHEGGYWKGFLTAYAVMYLGLPSPVVGGVIAAIAFASTKNKERDPLKCVECGYSLVALTSDKCPECGKKTP